MMPRLFRPENPAPQNTLTVRELVAVYRRHCDAEGVHCAMARKDREYVFKLFVAALGDLDVAECRPFHLTDFIEAHPEWKSVGTRRAKANMVRACFNWAAEQERIARNPFKAVRYAESERRPELPDADLARIEEEASKPFERILRFMRLTWCRATEACEATWADVDLDRGIWTIPKHKSRRYTRKAKVVALVPEAVVLLRSIPEARATPASTAAGAVVGVPQSDVAALAPLDRPIFLNTRGDPYTRDNLWRCLRNAKRRLGLRTTASVHGIRHRGITAALANGAPLLLVSEQAGHANPAITTKSYWHKGEREMDAIRQAAQLGVPEK